MDSIIIKGGSPLIGEINISGAKNACLPIMAASLLTDQDIILNNIPDLSDVATMCKLLNHHGSTINIKKNDHNMSLNINNSKIKDFVAPYDIVRKMRASIWVLGPLLTKFGEAKVSLPGGCAIGARQVDLHISSMQALGANIEIKEGYICAKVKGRLKGCVFSFDKPSVGATINAVLAAVLAKGDSHFMNCAKEPEIIDLCNFLNKMGAHIEGIGTSELLIQGKDELKGIEYTIMPDRIEAGTYMIAAAITKGDLLIKNIDYSLIENLAIKMNEAGIKIDHTDSNIRVTHKGKINPVNISTQPYPGFSTDLQAQFMSLMTLAEGTSVISENIFENRFMHIPELCRMGANITVKDHSAIVYGVKELSGSEVMASDLRASVSLIISGLCAKGTTKVNRVYHLDRGYQNLVEKLKNCGADIKRIKNDTN